MKKIIAILLAMLMVFSFAACGETEEAKDRLAKIKEAGVLTVATEPYFAPYEFIDPNAEGDAQFLGMDIEFAKILADRLGVELQIVPLEFTAVLSGVTEGKYDLAISAIAWSPAREEAMRMSDGYYFSTGSGYGFLVREEDVDKYNSVEDLADAVVVTQSGSVQEAIYNNFVNGACKEFKLTSGMPEAYLEVAEGKADVCICSKKSATLYAEANGGLVCPEFKFETDPSWSSNRVTATLEGTESLMAEVNAVIAELIAEDKFNTWFDEYAEKAKELGIE